MEDLLRLLQSRESWSVIGGGLLVLLLQQIAQAAGPAIVDFIKSLFSRRGELAEAEIDQRKEFTDRAVKERDDALLLSSQKDKEADEWKEKFRESELKNVRIEMEAKQNILQEQIKQQDILNKLKNEHSEKLKDMESAYQYTLHSELQKVKAEQFMNIYQEIMAMDLETLKKFVEQKEIAESKVQEELDARNKAQQNFPRRGNK